MERLTYRDNNGRALLTNFGKQMYCSSQATADCVCKLEESLEDAISMLKAQETTVPLEPLCRYLEVYARTPIYNMRHTAEWWKEELKRQNWEKWMEENK